LACYEEESEEFQSICKIGTGFSEEALAKFKDEFSNHIIPGPKPYYRYCDDHKPDVWFDDAFVWEVLAADLSISPAHRAALGKVDPDKGIALRFPRFIRVREDKGPTQATDATQVAEMYLRQFQNQTK
jgi:DNA ligase-1